MNKEYPIYVIGLIIVVLFFLFINTVELLAQTVGEQWVEDITAPLRIEYEDYGYSGRVYLFQDTSYMSIPNVFETLPATDVRGASGFVSLIDGATEASVIYALSTVNDVSMAIPYSLAGSTTPELQWFPLVDVSTLNLTVTTDSSSSSQSTIYQTAGVTTEDSAVWTYELPEGIRIDRDWEPFGGTMGGYSFKPGIGTGDFPGEDGMLFLSVLSGVIPANTKWELLYKYSLIANLITTPTGYSPDLPIHYFNQGGLGWR